MSAPGTPTAAGGPDDGRRRRDRTARLLLPLGVLGLSVWAWDLVVRLRDIPPYVLPGPRLVFATLWSDRALLLDSLVVTLTTTLEGFGLALVGGVGLAVLFNQSRLIDTRCIPMR